MKMILTGALLAAILPVVSAHAILYPQKALPAQTAGYDIHEGRELAPAPKPALAPARLAAPQRIMPPAAPEQAPQWIEFAPQPLAASPAPAPQPTSAPIEERGLVSVLGSAAGDLNRDVTYSGSAEAGLQYSTGNSELQDYNAKMELQRDSAGWLNRGSFEMALTEAEGESTEEEYRGELESQYKLSDRDFLFGEIDAERDLFSGYEFRVSEVLGYGRHWFKGDDFSWSSRAGAGYQHYEPENGDIEHQPVGRLQNDLEWQLAETLSLQNHLRLDVSNIQTLRTETYLKNQLIGSLFLKLGVETDYVSDVPAGNEKLDVDTRLNLSYEFE